MNKNSPITKGECRNCKKITSNTRQYIMYFGTSTQKTGLSIFVCDNECYRQWWKDNTWHLDTLDERMNVNIHFQRIKGNKGTYKGKPAKADWNGLEARHYLGEYEFKNRNPHPETCKGCWLENGSIPEKIDLH